MIQYLPPGWPQLAVPVVLLAVAAWLSQWAASRILHRVISGVTSRTRSTWDDRLVERKVFGRLAQVVPALVVYLGIGPALGVTEGMAEADPRDALVLAWAGPGESPQHSWPSPW